MMRRSVSSLSSSVPFSSAARRSAVWRDASESAEGSSATSVKHGAADEDAMARVCRHAMEGGRARGRAGVRGRELRWGCSVSRCECVWHASEALPCARGGAWAGAGDEDEEERVATRPPRSFRCWAWLRVCSGSRVLTATRATPGAAAALAAVRPASSPLLHLAPILARSHAARTRREAMSMHGANSSQSYPMLNDGGPRAQHFRGLTLGASPEVGVDSLSSH